MGIVAGIVVGAIAGFLANLIVEGGEGVLRTIILGVVGGLLGGFVAASLLKVGSIDGINLESILIATAGAVVVIAVSHLLQPHGLKPLHFQEPLSRVP